MKTLRLLSVLLLASSLFTSLLACEAGIPVRLRIDEFTQELAIDDLTAEATNQLRAIGLLPPGSVQLPELWPDSLPDVRLVLPLSTPPIPLDLTPDPGSGGDDYEAINKAGEIVTRIELNRLVLRVEANSLSFDLPDLKLQAAEDKDADPADRLAWRTIATIPGAAAGEVTDLELTWLPSGESFLNAQLRDEEKELALRVSGHFTLDTALEPRLPSGKALFRLIVVATFFVDPTGAL